jgi:hypothetical protein
MKHINKQSTSYHRIYETNIQLNITTMFTLASFNQDSFQPLTGLSILKPTRFSFRFTIIPHVFKLDAYSGSMFASLH